MATPAVTTESGAVSRGRFDSFARTTVSPSSVISRAVVSSRRRQISREAGRAIEMLGHAIEYVADELALDCMVGATSPRHGIHPRVAAIELLKERNREVFLSCPHVPTMAERFRALIRLLRG